MEIQRDSYLEQLIAYRWDGMVKVITGIRRCGKSYLLKVLFRRYLVEQGVKPEQIITIELDLAKDIKYRNPLELAAFVRGQMEGRAEQFYLFVDESRGFALRADDKVQVRRSKHAVQLVRLSERSFCEIFAQKMLPGGLEDEK